MAALDDSNNSLGWEHMQRCLLQGDILAAVRSTHSQRKVAAIPGVASHPHSPARHATRALHGAAAARDPSKSFPNMALCMTSPERRDISMARPETSHGLPGSYEEGDTQEVPSQVYRTFKSYEQTHQTAVDSQEASTIREDDAHASVARTPAAHGTVDIMGVLDTQGSIAAITPSVAVHDINDSHEDSQSPELLSSLRRDFDPRTPAVIGRNIAHRADFLSPRTISRSATSGFSTLKRLQPGQQMMTHTQMFENTQYESSPCDDRVRSDPVYTRPSPDHVTGPAESPHAAVISSPVDAYIPMQQSQEYRTAANLKSSARQTKVVFDGDDFSQDDQAILTRVKHHNKYTHTRLAVNKRGRDTLARSHSETIVARQSSDATYPRARSEDRLHEIVEIIDRPIRAPEAGETRDASNLHSPGHEAAESPMSVDEYGEFAQEVTRSQHGPSSQQNNTIVLQSEDCGMEVAGSPLNNATAALDGAGTTPRRSEVANRGDYAIEKHHSMLGPSGGVDSSLSQPARPMLPSTMGSYVPNTQIAPLSSQQKRKIREEFKATEISSLPDPPSMGSPGLKPVSSHVPSSPPSPQRPGSASLPHEIPNPVGTIDLQLDGSPFRGTDETDEASHGSVHPREQECEGRAKIATEQTSVFPTAETHLSASQIASRSVPAQLRQESTESPRKISRARKFAEIEGNALSQVPENSQALNDAMNLLADKDDDFVTAMRSPRRSSKTMVYGRAAKRRRTPVSHKRTVPALSPSASPTPIRPSLSPNLESTLPEQPDIKLPPRKRRRLHANQRRTTIPDTDGTTLSKVEHSVRQRSQICGKSSPAPVQPAQNEELIEEIEETAMSIDVSAADAGRKSDEAYDTEADHVRAPALGNGMELNKTGPLDAPPDAPPSDTAHIHRVLALFKGSPTAYYPATCTALAAAHGTQCYSIRFDDDTTSAVETHQICAFDLRVGDVIKVDLNGMRNHLCQVEELYTAKPGGEGLRSLPDSNGHPYARVLIKGQKRSSKASAEEGVIIPTSRIYLTHTMWPKFEHRTYSATPNAGAAANQYARSVEESLPGTPLSRSRRHTLNATSMLDVTHLPTPPTNGDGIFNGCAFALTAGTSGGGSQSRDELTRRIKSRGGIVFGDGLHEMFDMSLAGKPSDMYDPLAVQIRPEFQKLGFVAVIADGHCRVQKYMQALALGLPTLHSRWATDCCKAGKLIPWGRYLLPSGTSSTLAGAVRSRTLLPFDPASAIFHKMMEQREKLLIGGGVLLLQFDGKKPKAPRSKDKTDRDGRGDRRQAYAFLSLALGASKVLLVYSVSQAKARLVEPGEEWRWVHCPADSMAAVVQQLGGKADQLAASSAATAMGAARKHKRSSLGPKDSESADESGSRLSVLLHDGVRVVSDEFVIQSLILGALAEE